MFRSFIVPSLIILYVDMSVVLGFHYKRNHLAQLQMDDLRKNVPVKVNTVRGISPSCLTSEECLKKE